jgi:hypothetical protein
MHAKINVGVDFSKNKTFHHPPLVQLLKHKPAHFIQKIIGQIFCLLWLCFHENTIFCGFLGFDVVFLVLQDVLHHIVTKNI